MKILCVIDHFGSGGAQRQMVNLACGLKDKGHDIEIFIYHLEQNFFREAIDNAGIKVHEIKKADRFSLKVLFFLVQLIRGGGYKAVISFLDTPNIYCELASLAAWNTRVIVSERSSYLAETSKIRALIRSLLHIFADTVVTNSNSHSQWLRRYCWLRGKIKTIYNGYLIDSEVIFDVSNPPPLKLLAIGRVGPEKNCIRLIDALDIFYQRNGYVPKISWVGRTDQSVAGMQYSRDVYAKLVHHPMVKENWTWLGVRKDIPSLLEDHRALIHASLYEGLPNVVCEALVAGRPVLVSDVCDHPILVENGQRGFLFDPLDPTSIANSIERLVSQTDAEWRDFSINSRNYALEMLNLNRMIQEYEDLLVASNSC